MGLLIIDIFKQNLIFNETCYINQIGLTGMHAFIKIKQFAFYQINQSFQN
jgi:hypothetical protein